MTQHMTQTPNLAGLSAADRLLHQRIIVLGPVSYTHLTLPTNREV